MVMLMQWTFFSRGLLNFNDNVINLGTGSSTTAAHTSFSVMTDFVKPCSPFL